MMDFENFDRNDCSLLIKATKTGILNTVQHVLSLLSQCKQEQEEQDEDGMDEEAPVSIIQGHLRTSDRQGYTALHYAASLSYLQITKLLLQHADADCVNIESHDRSTALLLACQCLLPSQDKVALISCLLDAGADPNLPVDDPYALPLITVLENKCWPAAQLLLAAGASPVNTDFMHDQLPPVFFAALDVSTMTEVARRGGLDNSTWKKGMTNVLDYVLMPEGDSPINYTDLSGDHIFALYRIVAQHKPELISDETVVRAAEHQRQLAMLHDALSRVPHGQFHQLMIQKILTALHVWILTCPPQAVNKFVMLFHSSLVKSYDCQSDVRHSALIVLLPICSTELLPVLLKESATAKLPVAAWNAKLSRIIHLVPNEITIKIFNKLTRIMFRRTNAISAFLSVRHLIDKYNCRPGHSTTLDILKLLISKGVAVEATAFEAVLCVWTTTDQLKPDTETAACFTLLLDHYLLNPDNSIGDEKLMDLITEDMSWQPVALYSMLMEGMPVGPLMEHFTAGFNPIEDGEHVCYTFREDEEEEEEEREDEEEAPESLTMNRLHFAHLKLKFQLKVLTLVVLSNFVDRTPGNLFPPLHHSIYDSKTKSLVAFCRQHADVKPLQQLARLAVRERVGSQDLRSKLRSLLSHTVSPYIVRYLCYDQEDDLVQWMEEVYRRIGHRMTNLD